MHRPSDVEALDPIACAVLDCRNEEIVVFDRAGRVLYANSKARNAMSPGDVRLQLLARGGQPTLLRVAGVVRGEVVVLPPPRDTLTIAQLEDLAIRQALEDNGGRLAATARRLGISRTTLWRRLKARELVASGADR